MGSWGSPELNAILISTLLTIIGAATPVIVAWFRLQTRKLDEMARANKELLEKNTEISRSIERQTDGINKKMLAIAEVVAFTKGRIKEKRITAGIDPDEDLYSLEKEFSSVSDDDFGQTIKEHSDK